MKKILNYGFVFGHTKWISESPEQFCSGLFLYLFQGLLLFGNSSIIFTILSCERQK